MEEEFHDMTDCESVNKSEGADPLDCADDTSSMFTNDIVMTVVNRLKDPFGLPEFAIHTIDYKKECSDTSQSESTEPKRRYKNETKEQQEIRLLRQRMIQMKSRIFECLMLPEKVQEERKRSTETRRQRRKAAREKETPEEAAARKKRHAERTRMSRMRLQALETPEQTAERIAKRNERQKLRNQARHAKETPEERAARLEKKRIYMAELNKKYKTGNYLAAKTGKLSEPKEKKIEKNTSELTGC